MKLRFAIITFFLLSVSITRAQSDPCSSGYICDISIRDLSEIAYNYNRYYNPILRRTYTYNTSGYLVGISHYNSEIDRTNITIEDVQTLIDENQSLKKNVQTLIDENESLKKQVTNLTKSFTELCNYVGFSINEDNALNNTASSKFSIYTANQNIVIKNAYDEPITIFQLNGVVIKDIDRADSNDLVFPVYPGIYVVRIGTEVTKIIIP